MAWGPWPVAVGSHGCAWRRRSRTPDPSSPRRPLGPRGAVHHAPRAWWRASLRRAGRWPWPWCRIDGQRFDCVTGDSLRCVSASTAVLPLWPISLIESRVCDNVLK
ncbi:hypothetical protein VPH35_117297 [Triticum aestivum]